MSKNYTPENDDDVSGIFTADLHELFMKVKVKEIFFAKTFNLIIRPNCRREIALDVL